MTEKTDIIIIGAGPAGISAALMARNMGKRVIIVSTDPGDSGLHKAERIDNYPGLPSVTGTQLLELFTSHAVSLDIEFIRNRVIAISRSGNGFYVAAGAEAIPCSAVILATGVVRGRAFPGEHELLGSGVSYCAACDGLLFKNKRVAVIGLASDAPHEAEILRGLGCQVQYFDNKSHKYEIHGTDRVTGLTANGTFHEVDGVFIFRAGIAPGLLFPGIEMDGNHIKTDRSLETSVDGIFAAGDCTGKPYQIAKAVGEGNIAALSAVEWIGKTT